MDSDSTLWNVFDEAVGELGHAGVSFIAEPGKLPRSRWLPQAKEEPVFLAYSITKMFTATVVLQLCDEGRLGLEDRLSRWFPRIEQAATISISRLLNHTAGIPDYGSLPKYHDAVRRSPSSPWTFDEYARETFEQGLSFKPGEGWLYSSPGYMLLRAIIEEVSGQTYSQLLGEKVFSPLGLTRSFIPECVADLESLAPAMSTLLSVDRTTLDTRLHCHPGWVSHGVVAAPPSEVAIFVDALFGGRLLSAQSLEAMTYLVAVPKEFAPGYPGEPSYGLGVMGNPKSELGLNWWGHDGGGPGYQASVRHVPTIGATVCVMAGIESGFSPRHVAWDMLKALVK